MRVGTGDWGVVIGTGVLMGAHWVSYFYALQWSSVAVGMLTLFTYPVMTALLEPLLLKTRWQPVHLVLASLVLLGVYFLQPTSGNSENHWDAVCIGLLSALAYALRNLLIKKRMAQYNGTSLMVYQTAIIGLVLFPFILTYPLDVTFEQWRPLVALALLTTAIGHSLFLGTFGYFNITTVSILSSIQPVYGILIGAVFLLEIPDPWSIVGGVLILSAVVIESIRVRHGS